MKELREKAAKLLHDARALMNTIDAEIADPKHTRTAWTADETAQYQKFMDDYDATREQIQRADRVAAAEAAMASPGPVAGRAAPAAAAGVQTTTATPEYRAAFWQAMRTGVPEEYRALSVGTDTAGGYMVPDEFRRQLIEGLTQEAVMRKLASVFTSTSGVMTLPVLTTNAAAVWTAENVAYGTTEPVFSAVTLSAYKETMLTTVSEELLQDSAFDVQGILQRQYIQGLGVLEETAFTVGDGSGKPTGIVGGSSVGATATATNAITADELMDLYYSLGRAYRARASWIMADGTIKAIRKLKTGVSSDNTYLWSPGLSAGEPDTLMGRPVYAGTDMPAATTGLKPVLFGDIGYYYIADRQAIGLQRLNELYAANGQVGFRIFRRTDGKLSLAAAVKHLIMA